MSRLVSPDMADTTTTTLCPASAHLMARRATFLMRSTDPTEVPPYFWTISAMIALDGHGACALLALPFQGNLKL